jgi:dolichyl-phosphate beta-glucosyltransferase
LTFTTPNTRLQPSPLPTLSSPAEIVMSVVVPAYNEESRIKTMLAEAVHYLDKTYLGNGEWEILVVDDGSSDETSKVALDWAAELQDAGAFDDGQVRVCRLEKNRGKGGAVSHVPPDIDFAAYNVRGCNMSGGNVLFLRMQMELVSLMIWKNWRGN